jgi:hypothetical protein
MLLPLGGAQAGPAGEIVLLTVAAPCTISLADAVLVARAPAGGRIASSDGPLPGVAASAGIATTALPTRTGAEQARRRELNPDARDSSYGWRAPSF